jgi:cysteine synthase A
MQILEPTSGNTGIALAYVAASKGYPLTLTIPQSMSEERKRLLTALGANLVVTPAIEGMAGAIRRAYQLLESGDFWMPMQFDNPANPRAHEESTGPEIWQAAEGRVDVFVAGVGTGGTVSGVGRYLRKQNPGVHIYAVEPAESPAISAGRSGRHGIQGIGAGFIPKNLDLSLINDVLTVSTEEAIRTARSAARLEGLAAGISTGANLTAAIRLAQRPEYSGATIVTVAPSAAERYLSTPLYAEQAVEGPGLLEQAATAMGIHFSI